MSNNFNKTGWVNSIRTIDSYVDVTPSLDNGDAIFNNAIIIAGGFNNTINNYRQSNNTGSIFVALGYGYSSNSQYSTDGGKTWNKNNLPTEMYWRRCRFANGVFFAIGQQQSSASTKVFYSYDGIVWGESSLISGGYYTDITYSKNYGKFVMVGSSKIATSSDGINWTEHSASKQYKSCYCYEGYDFIVAVPLQVYTGISYIELSGDTISERTAPSSVKSSDYGLYGDIQVNSAGEFYAPIVDTRQHYDSNDNLTGCDIMIKFAKSDDGWVWTFTDYVVNEHFNKYIDCNADYLSFNISDENTFALLYSYLPKVYFWKDDISNIQSLPYTIDFPRNVLFMGEKLYLYSTSSAEYTDDYMNWTKLTYNLYGGYSHLESGINTSFIELLEYSPQADVSYFDGDRSSIKLSNSHLVSAPIQYSSKYTTNASGYVENGGVVIRLQTNGGSCRYIEIVGDLAKYEFPKDFAIKFPSDSEYINTEDRVDSLETNIYEVTDNNLVHCIVDLGEVRTLPNFIEIEITRWSTPYSNVKLNYIGTNIRYAFNSKNILKSFELNTDVKNYDEYGYGLKYNQATMNLYNIERSAGRYILHYETWSDGSLQSYKNVVVKPITIIDILVDCQIDSLYRFYVKNNVDNSFVLIGKYYSIEIEYNTQSDNILITLHDVCNRLQSIEYSGPSYRITFEGMRSATLTEVLTAIKSDLKTIYNINFDIFNKYSDNIVIDKVVFNSSTVWGVLEQCCQIGMFYVVAEHTKEDIDIKIFDGR